MVNGNKNTLIAFPTSHSSSIKNKEIENEFAFVRNLLRICRKSTAKLNARCEEKTREIWLPNVASTLPSWNENGERSVYCHIAIVTLRDGNDKHDDVNDGSSSTIQFFQHLSFAR